MARPLRLEYLGAWYHVTARGNERRDIFRDDRDRERFVTLLAELEKRYGLEVHGYVLMPNHYHLMLRLNRESGLSKGMQWLAVSYTVWFNRRHRRSGHLFQGRFKSVVVEFERWGQELSRYVHLNPVRVKALGLSKSARKADRVGLGERLDKSIILQRLKMLREFRWSSYPSYTGYRRPPEWLRTEVILNCLGRGRAAKLGYRKYVETAIRSWLEESPWERLAGGLILGGNSFVEELRKRIAGDPKAQPKLKQLHSPVTFERIVECVSQLKGERWEDFVNRRGDWGRDLVLLAARQHTALTNRELGERVGGIDHSAVAQAVKRIQRRLRGNHPLRQMDRELSKHLSLLR